MLKSWFLAEGEDWTPLGTPEVFFKGRASLIQFEQLPNSVTEVTDNCLQPDYHS